MSDNEPGACERHLAFDRAAIHGFGPTSAGDDEIQGRRSDGARHAQSNLTRLFRRASISVRHGVRGIVHRRPSVPTTPTTLDPEFQHHTARGLASLHVASASDGAPCGGGSSSSAPAAARPPSQSTWRRLRHFPSFHRHSRLPVSSTGDDQTGAAPDLETIDSPTSPVPGSGEQPPVIPRNSGAAARQAAASACAGPAVSDLPLPVLGPSSRDETELRDSESGIGIAAPCKWAGGLPHPDEFDQGLVCDTDDDPRTRIAKVDFVANLPVELGIQILAQLDGTTLAMASRVSRAWHQITQNQHIWRESFLGEKTSTYATSGGRVKPGEGMGVPDVEPGNDWKSIYQAKQELDTRWREGRTKPIWLHGHSDSVYCLQFDENKIITGSRDKTVRIWDMRTYECKLVIGPPDLLNDKPLSVLVHEHGTLKHWAIAPEVDPASAHDGPSMQPHYSTPALYAPLVHHNASILCLQYDDRMLATGSSDGTCILYDIKRGYRPFLRLSKHTAAVLDLCFDDKHIVTCSKDVSICVWDRTTGALLKQLKGHSGPVNAVQMRGNTIVSCSGDFRVKLWNIETGKNIREFLGHKKGLACSQFSEDGRYVASAGNDRAIRLWDANTGDCVRVMEAHDSLVRSLWVDSVSGRLVSGSYDTDIKVWDMETGQQLLDFPRWHHSWVLSAKSDYRRIVSSGQDPKLLILDFGADVKGIELLESKSRRPQQPDPASTAKPIDLKSQSGVSNLNSSSTSGGSGGTKGQGKNNAAGVVKYATWKLVHLRRAKDKASWEQDVEYVRGSEI